MLNAEKAAASSDQGKPMVELLTDFRADKKLSSAANWDNSNNIRDGNLVRAPDEMIRIAAAIFEKTAETTNVSCVFGTRTVLELVLQ